MARVLVTGANGFVGRHAVPALLQRGHDVVFNTTDLLEPGAPARVVAEEQPEAVLHLAWLPTTGRYWTSRENVRWVQASLELLQAMHGRRAVGVGTCAEYRWHHEHAGTLHEQRSMLAPASPYGRCKAAVALAGSALDDLSFAWARLFFLYGPGEAENRIVPRMIRSGLRGKAIGPLPGGLVRDFLYVRDAAAALAELLVSDLQGPVNIASGEERTLREVAHAVAEAVGDPSLPLHERPPDREPPVLVGHVGRMRGELGYTPVVSLRDGLAATVRSMR